MHPQRDRLDQVQPQARRCPAATEDGAGGAARRSLAGGCAAGGRALTQERLTQQYMRSRRLCSAHCVSASRPLRRLPDHRLQVGRSAPLQLDPGQVADHHPGEHEVDRDKRPDQSPDGRPRRAGCDPPQPAVDRRDGDDKSPRPAALIFGTAGAALALPQNCREHGDRRQHDVPDKAHASIMR